MTSISNDHLTRLAFSIYENKGVYALLIGSGVSRAAHIPTGWEITLDLVRRVALAQGVEEQADWAAWYRSETGDEPDYSKLVEELGQTPNERRSILHSYIEPTEEDRENGHKVPTAAHEAVADLVRAGFVRVIVTTNFDRLMENALRERGVEPTVVGSVDALAGAEPLTHSQCFLLKLHGDYKDARIRNTDAELTGYPAEFDLLLDRILDEHGLITCGWSGEWDHALRAAITRYPSRRYSMFWAARGEPGEGAKELITHRDGRVVPISDADSFFTQVRDRVETLKQTHRREPRSIDLLVASTKRFLSLPEYRIQLDDLFVSETDLLFVKLGASGYTNDGQWSPDDFRARVAFYEAATEPLVRMAMVLGRWGDDKETGLVLDVIRSICAEADKNGTGLVPWVNLRTYPAVLLLTGYGLGLVRAQRWDTLHKVLSSEIPRRQTDGEKRIVERLFLWAWPGGDNNLWRSLPDFDLRKTALSDHLVELFAIWRGNTLGMLADFEELYETWEILGSIIHLERHDLVTIKAAVENEDRRDFEWMPVGRSAWHSEMRNRILTRVENDPLRAELLSAGLAKGDEEFLRLTLANYRRISGRI